MKKTTQGGIRNEYIAICNEKGCKFEFNFMEDESVKLGRKTAGLSFITDDDGFSWIEGEGEKYTAEIVEKNQNRYHLLINGNSYHFSVETPFSYKRKKFLSKLKKGSKQIRVASPMPGKIVEVIANEGDVVAVGDPILILEAMKMQNEIRAEVAGTITGVHVRQGQNVMKDEVLFEIAGH